MPTASMAILIAFFVFWWNNISHSILCLMTEFNKKRPYRKFIYSPITLFLLFIVLIIILKAAWGVYQKERISAEYLAREQNVLEELADRQAALAQSVDYLKTDKGIEAEIRSKFRVVKEGEMVAVIVDNEDVKNSTASTTTQIAPSSFWQKMRVWFSGIMRPSQG